MHYIESLQEFIKVYVSIFVEVHYVGKLINLGIINLNIVVSVEKFPHGPEFIQGD